MNRQVALGLVLFVVVACGEEGAGPKGDEDDPFDDYELKEDSFFAPTQHGTLLFDYPSNATLSDGELFHAWDFTLTRTETIALWTELQSDNLDTVMYLYRVNPETGEYGSYIEKNDDHGESMASRIAGEFEAGQYRVLVKGHKTYARGRFQLVGECETCEEGVGECDPNTYGDYPGSYATPCGEAIYEALSDNNHLGWNDTSVSMEDHCDLPPAARIALNAYYAYWDGIAGFDDMFDYGEGVSIEIAWSTYSNGTVYVGVDGGGDEAAMDYLIDADGQVVVSYLHNQSPEFEAFCSDGSLSPDPDCGHLYLQAKIEPREDEQSGTMDGVTETTQLSPVLALANRTYRAELSLQGDEPVNISYQTWRAGVFDNDPEIGEITIEAEGQDSITYELGIEYDVEYIFTEQRGDATRELRCEWD